MSFLCRRRASVLFAAVVASACGSSPGADLPGTTPGAAGSNAAGAGQGSTGGSGAGGTGAGGVSTAGTSAAGSGTGGQPPTAGEGGSGTATPGDPVGGASGAGSGGAVPAGGSSGAAVSGGSGGGSGGAASKSDPAPGQYARRAVLPAANSEMAVAEAGGKIYVIGGYPSSRVTQDTVQAYDPKTDSWAYTEPLPVPMHHPVAVGVAGKLYVLGAQLANADTNRTLEYDPIADAWRDLATMPTARGAGAGAALGDQIYVAGGRPPAGNAFEMYDISDNRWTELPDLPQTLPERNHIAAAAIGGKIYVAGGRYSGGSFSDPMTASLDVYDPATQRWTQGAPMLRPRGGVNGVAANGCFYVWGGEGPDTGEPNDVFPDHDVYNPRTNAWTALAPLPVPVHGVTGGVFLDGIIYMPGGGTRQGGSSGGTQFQVYRPLQSCL